MYFLSTCRDSLCPIWLGSQWLIVRVRVKSTPSLIFLTNHMALRLYL